MSFLESYFNFDLPALRFFKDLSSTGPVADERYGLQRWPFDFDTLCDNISNENQGINYSHYPESNIISEEDEDFECSAGALKRKLHSVSSETSEDIKNDRR